MNQTINNKTTTRRRYFIYTLSHQVFYFIINVPFVVFGYFLLQSWYGGCDGGGWCCYFDFFLFCFGDFNQHSLLNWILYMHISDRTANEPNFYCLFICECVCVCKRRERERERAWKIEHQLERNKHFLLSMYVRAYICVRVFCNNLKTYHPLVICRWGHYTLFERFSHFTTWFPSNQSIKIILNIRRGKIL